MTPKPYYSDDWVTLYHGDCRAITEWRRAEVLVTDPPYGMAYVSNSSKYRKSDAIEGDATADLRDEILELWGRKPALVFGTWRVDRPVGVRQLVVWDKGDSPGMGDVSLPWGPAHEEVYVLGEGFTGRRKANVLRFPTLAPGDRNRPDHPTPKPVDLMRDLISYCPPGVIADPFAGSGATLRAAKDLGRRAIGVELEERYCEIIAKRLAQDAFDFGASA